MNKKSVKKVIHQKFNNFLDSITDENVKKLVKENTLISGGCIASMLMGEKVNDYDLYFTNKETALAVTNYYVDLFKQKNTNHRIQVLTKNMEHIPVDVPTFIIDALNGSEEDRIKIFVTSSGVAADPEYHIEEHEDVIEENSDKPLYMPIHLSSNAITLSGKIQLVIRFFGDAKEIHSNYDYVHCTNYWLSANNQLVLNQEALESIMAKELIYMGSKYPIASLIRTRKFINRGWFINAGQYLKMAFQISQLDLQNIVVLEDQLMGVDALYFSMLIDALRAKQESTPDWAISENYIITLIDKIF